MVIYIAQQIFSPLYSLLQFASVNVSHETVIHQFFKYRLSLVHSRDACLCIFTHILVDTEIWTSSNSTPDLENYIFFHFTLLSFLLATQTRMKKKKRFNVRAYITVFPLVTSHLIQLIALFSHFSWFFPFLLFFLFPSWTLKKRFLFLLFPLLAPHTTQSRTSPANLFMLSYTFIVFHPYK